MKGKVAVLFVFTGGQFPEVEKAQPLFKRKPEWVVAADSGLDVAEIYGKQFGFSVNQIVGDMDSLVDYKNRLLCYNQKAISLYPKDKDFSDTELALMAVHERRKKNQLVVLIGGDGGRVDHLFAIKEVCSKIYRPDLWICREQFLYTLTPEKKTLCIELKDDETLSVFSCGNGTHSICSSGLKWPLEQVEWQNGQYSLSNKSDCSGLVKIAAKEGVFLIILSIQRLEGFLQGLCL
ncbi:MAG: thiamine diphosphokinase [Spirochaetaceae bacterium]|nr:thiamine diphosphokinase [Spirochaetaceae bacterium]